MDPTCHTLTLPSPCAAPSAVMEADAFPKLPRCVVAVVEADPVFPAVERRQVAHDAFPSSPPASLPFTPFRSSPSPPCVRHERLLKLLAFVGPIRELRSTNSKFISPEAPTPL